MRRFGAFIFYITIIGRFFDLSVEAVEDARMEPKALVPILIDGLL